MFVLLTGMRTMKPKNVNIAAQVKTALRLTA